VRRRPTMIQLELNGSRLCQLDSNSEIKGRDDRMQQRHHRDEQNTSNKTPQVVFPGRKEKPMSRDRSKAKTKQHNIEKNQRLVCT